MKVLIPKLNSSYFTWSLWRSGSIADLGIICKEEFIIANSKVIKKYAIGYCKGESLMCRPKISVMAVMFKKDDLIFWNHLTIKEFNKIFKEELCL